MPKFSRKKKGHLIGAEVEFTVVRNKEVAHRNTWHSYQYKIATFPTIEEAADCARNLWVDNCNAGMFNETCIVYRHTKGKTAYSDGHFQVVQWTDFDYTRKVTKPSSQP